MSKEIDASDLIIKEVNEELQQEQFNQLWNKYGFIIIAAAILLVAAVAGKQIWHGYKENLREKEGARFAQALAKAETDKALALNEFASLASESKTGYAIVAKFKEAALHLEAGDKAKAAAAYDLLSKDGAIPQTYRDFAILKFALLETDKGEASLDSRLATIANPQNPFRFSAYEIQALLAIKKGDNETARQLYAKIADDAQAPRQLRGRATEMLQALPKPVVNKG